MEAREWFFSEKMLVSRFRTALLGFLAVGLLTQCSKHEGEEGSSPKSEMVVPDEAPAAAPTTSGAETVLEKAANGHSALIYAAPGFYDGYTLLAPLASKTTYLLNGRGEIVHTWESDFFAGRAAYLCEDGSLLRCGTVPLSGPFKGLRNSGGLIEKFSWDGELLWSFRYSDEQHHSHHDVEPLPNGNVLLLAWEYRSREDLIAAGRDPNSIAKEGLLIDTVIEVQPDQSGGAEVVWKWSVWDHLVQDRYPDKPNYGDVANAVGRIDLNYNIRNDRGWIHLNSVSYHEELDQIVLSARDFSELWVIDHGTTKEEAAASTGGKRGRGGEILYRWGNPQTYRAGNSADQQLFRQHDVQWISAGSPGAGNFLVFNNGWGRPDEEYSSVEEIVPPLKGNGLYARAANEAYGPTAPVWHYEAAVSTEMYADRMSGAQRLPNGNTLICLSRLGVLKEVTPKGELVWQYRNPYGQARMATGPMPAAMAKALNQQSRGNGKAKVPDARDVQGIAGPPRGPQSAGRKSVFKVRRYAIDDPRFEGEKFNWPREESNKSEEIP